MMKGYKRVLASSDEPRDNGHCRSNTACTLWGVNTVLRMTSTVASIEARGRSASGPRPRDGMASYQACDSSCLTPPNLGV